VNVFTMPPRGLDTTALPEVYEAVELVLSWLYHPGVHRPLMFKRGPNTDRNSEVYNLYAQGWSVPKLSREFGISKPRVYQILKNVRRGRVS
jgi:hypothetical protein